MKGGEQKDLLYSHEVPLFSSDHGGRVGGIISETSLWFDERIEGIESQKQS